jgi:hypothetical protein
LRLALLIVVPLGFAAKFYGGPGGWWVRDYGAGVLYEVFWILLVSAARPSLNPAGVALGVFVVTCALEFLQLWHPAPLEAIRATFLGRTLIGSTFSWWDFPHYAIGSALGAWSASRPEQWRHPSGTR